MAGMWRIGVAHRREPAIESDADKRRNQRAKESGGERRDEKPEPSGEGSGLLLASLP